MDQAIDAELPGMEQAAFDRWFDRRFERQMAARQQRGTPSKAREKQRTRGWRLPITHPHRYPTKMKGY